MAPDLGGAEDVGQERGAVEGQEWKWEREMGLDANPPCTHTLATGRRISRRS
jgi:hypothetical protein